MSYYIRDTTLEAAVVNTGASKRPRELVVGDAGGFVFGPVGAKDGCLLLSDANEYLLLLHYLALVRVVLEVGSSDLHLSLTLMETNNGNGLLLGKAFHSSGKVPGKVT